MNERKDHMQHEVIICLEPLLGILFFLDNWSYEKWNGQQTVSQSCKALSFSNSTGIHLVLYFFAGEKKS